MFYPACTAAPGTPTTKVPAAVSDEVVPPLRRAVETFFFMLPEYELP